MPEQQGAKQTDECLNRDHHVVGLAGREYIWPEPNLITGRKQRAAIGRIIDWLDVPFSDFAALGVDSKRVSSAEEAARLNVAVIDKFSKEKLFGMANVILDFFYNHNKAMRKDRAWLNDNAANDAEIFAALMDLLGYLSRPFMAKGGQVTPAPEVNSTPHLPDTGASQPST
jgi:hypothetical protein